MPQDGGPWAGLVPRWEVTFNFSMLRLVSFGMDWYWAQLDCLDQVAEEGSEFHASPELSPM